MAFLERQKCDSSSSLKLAPRPVYHLVMSMTSFRHSVLIAFLAVSAR